MKLEPQTLKYYQWDDVEAFLAEKMEIPVDKFRNYHDIVGGKYKDFWHVWGYLIKDKWNHDEISTIWFNTILNKTDKKETIDEFGEWAAIIFPAIEELQKEVNDKRINILYSF